jgi:hypothetical protein
MQNVRKSRNQTETEAAASEQRTTHSREATTLSSDRRIILVRYRASPNSSSVASGDIGIAVK